MAEQVDVVIVGCGLVGLSAAIAMKKRNFSVAILDASTIFQQDVKPNLRVYAINRASKRLLEALQVWPKMDSAELSPYLNMYVWDAVSRGHIDFDTRLGQLDRLGTIIEESVLKQALLQQAKEEGIFFVEQAKVVAVDKQLHGMRINTASEEYFAKLLIVADGAQSTTRDLLKVSITSWPYHQDAVIATVDTEFDHQQTAYQVFHTKGPLAFLPLVNRQQCSIVWSTSKGHAKQLMALSDDAFKEALTVQFERKLGQILAISERRQFPLSMRHAKLYSGEHWLLMGDAAHTIHPLAGLGLNIGLADLAAWLSIFDKHPKLGAKKIMEAYQRQRKHDVWQKIFLMEGLKHLFGNPLPPVPFLRKIGLNVCNEVSLLKRAFIEHAAGELI